MWYPINERKNEISKNIIEGYDIYEISKNYNLEIRNLKNVKQFSQITDSNLLENEIIKQSFTSNKDFVSDLYDFNDQISFIFNVDNIYPSKPI